VLGPDGSRTIDQDLAVRWETEFGTAELTHINLYDRTVEGLALRDVQGATVQYHPEAGPGPNDALHLFDRFVGEIAARGGEAGQGGLGENSDIGRGIPHGGIDAPKNGATANGGALRPSDGGRP
jgi:carbamoyl-phosphate synthase small subunit